MSEIAEFARHLGYYLSPPDVALVERAFAFSKNAHQGQFRKSGRNVRFQENRMTAKVLGLTIRQSLLLRADEVIQ